MMRSIIRPERNISEYVEQSIGTQPPAANEIATATRELTDEVAYLVGHGRNFVGRRGELMYKRARAKHGWQLRRIGATALHCPRMPALQFPSLDQEFIIIIIINRTRY
jgi:hypothetical protein